MAKTTKTAGGNASGATAAKAAMAKTNGGGDRVAFARRPENIGQMEVTRPQTGAEYIESLRDGREVFIYGERVEDVTTHPAFATPHGWWRAYSMPCMTTSERKSCCCRQTPAMGE